MRRAQKEKHYVGVCLTCGSNAAWGVAPPVSETGPVTSWVARLSAAERIELTRVVSPRYFEYRTPTNWGQHCLVLYRCARPAYREPPAAATSRSCSSSSCSRVRGLASFSKSVLHELSVRN